MTRSLTSYLGWATVAVVVVLFCAAAPAPAAPVFEWGQPAPPVVALPLQKLTFKIKNMSCPSCAASYMQALILSGGIRYMKIDLHVPGDADTTVIFDVRFVNRERILDLLHKFHFIEGNVK